MNDRDEWNRTRHDRASGAGHYESWFMRANHPTRPLAFWVRYTIFSPLHRPEAALGELWAIAFDGERKSIAAVKEEHPLAGCEFSRTGLAVRVAESTLDGASLRGSARSKAHSLAWDLEYESPQRPILLVPAKMIPRAFPKAKQTTPSPCAVFRGSVTVDGERVAVDGWVGAQSHNWGKAHTDAYAWCQVAGFDDAPDAYFEAGTARYKFGPIRTPRLTGVVLRLDGRDHLLSSTLLAVRARATYAPFHWELATHDRDVRISAVLSAPASAFIALPYPHPPGGTKTCLNSKLAFCKLTIERDGKTRTLTTQNRAAFEILTDEAAPSGVTRLA